MDKVRETRRPWRSWTVIALVLATLALAQACGDSGHRTSGPTKTTPVALKVNRAQLPAGCTGTLIVDGPNGFHLEVAIPANGQVTISLPIGQTVTLTAFIICNGETFSDSTTLTPGPGNNDATLTVVATKAGITCPGQIKIGDTANCTCTIQSPTTPVVTWVGATPTGATTASFTGTVVGPHDVTCLVNGGASATTKVTVQSPTPAAPPVGSITVHNNSPFSASVSFSPGSIARLDLGPGGTGTRSNVPANQLYTATAVFNLGEGSCSGSIGFFLDPAENEVLNFAGCPPSND